jgi:hypothetical protein
MIWRSPPLADQCAPLAFSMTTLPGLIVHEQVDAPGPLHVLTKSPKPVGVPSHAPPWHVVVIVALSDPLSAS